MSNDNVIQMQPASDAPPTKADIEAREKDGVAKTAQFILNMIGALEALDSAIMPVKDAPAIIWAKDAIFHQSIRLNLEKAEALPGWERWAKFFGAWKPIQKYKESRK